jgi:hypothetical protein
MRSASHSLLASLRDAKNKPAVPSRNIMETPPGCAAQKRIFGITEIEGGFPHSEIRGSKVVRTSPRLIAAYHVLHRLSAPRHPPNTLKALDRSHYRRPPLGRGSHGKPCVGSIERPFASNISESVAVKPRSQLAARLLKRCEARSTCTDADNQTSAR